MKKYYLIATLVILAGLYSYHFLAAERAEEQLDEAIQEQMSKQPDSLNIQYSEIDISPFRGNITFKDLNVISSTYIERAHVLTFDLSYWDFLTIYIGGAESVLNQDGIFKLIIENASLLQRETLQETKFVHLEAAYNGNLWETIRNFAAGIPLQKAPQIQINASGFRYLQPKSPIGSFTSDSLTTTIQIIQQGNSFRGQTETAFTSVTWTPPADFQQNYEFFIKGFGFQPDSIPIEHALFSMDFNYASQQVTLNNSTISTNLAQLMLSGNGRWASTVSKSYVDTLVIRGSKFSEQFQNVLNNAEQLLDIRLPKEGNDIVIKLSGNIASLKIIEQ